MAPAHILGPDADNGEGWKLLWTHLQGLLGVDPGGPCVPKNFQPDCGRHNKTLGDGGGAGGGWIRGTQEAYTGVGGFFYVDDGLSASLFLERLQKAFNITAGIFD